MYVNIRTGEAPRSVNIKMCKVIDSVTHLTVPWVFAFDTDKGEYQRYVTSGESNNIVAQDKDFNPLTVTECKPFMVTGVPELEGHVFGPVQPDAIR